MSTTSLNGMQIQIRNRRFPVEYSLEVIERLVSRNRVPEGVMHRPSNFSNDPSSVPSLFNSTCEKFHPVQRIYIRLVEMNANLNMGKCLTIQD